MINRPPNIFIQNAFFAYEQEVIFENLNLHLPAGKCTCLLGPSGVGKTTLLRWLAGLLKKPLSGELTSDIPIQNNVAYLAQTDLLLPWLSALNNTLLSEHLTKKISSQKMIDSKKLLMELGLNNIENKFPHQLSGGMRQRVAIARTLLQDKPILLMDEPFSSVDAITRFECQNIIAQYFENRTILLVTHDPMEALRLADEIVILRGSPAKAKNILSLDSKIPRDLTHPDVISHQAKLFSELIEAKSIQA